MKATYNQFTGGINNFIDAQNLPAEFAVDVVDATVSNGSIVPLPGAATSIVPKSDFTLYNPTGQRSLARFGKTIFWSDNATGELSSSLGYMGVPAPSAHVHFEDGFRGDRFEGMYQYAFAFRSREGFLSATAPPGSPRSVSFSADRETVSLQSQDATPYRTSQQVPRIIAVLSTNEHQYQPRTFRYGYRAGTVVSDRGRYYKAKQDIWNITVTPTKWGWNPRKNGVLEQSHPLSPDQRPPNLKYWQDITLFTTNVGGLDKINIKNLPVSTDSFIGNVVILRTLRDAGVFYVVGEVPNGTTSFADSVSDETLMLSESIDMTKGNEPLYTSVGQDVATLTGGKYLTELIETFYLAAGAQLFVSEQSNPHSWDPLKYLQFDEEITALVAGNASVIVFTLNKRYVVTGTNFADLARIELPTRQGCPNWRTVASLGNNLVWQSNDGIVTFGKQPELEGDRTTLVTADRYVFDGVANFAVVANDVYYLFYDDHAVAIDFKHGMNITRLALTGYRWAWWDENNDRLHLLSSGGGWEDIAGGPGQRWTYVTPRMHLTEGRQPLQLRRLYIDADEDVYVEVILDGKAAWSKTLTRRHRRRDLQSYVARGLIGTDVQLQLRSKGTMRSITIDFRQL
jgi:hypothetical protein